MTLDYACIAPHGGELIPKLAGSMKQRFSETRKGMRILARRIAAVKPDTIVIASPHSLRLVGKIAIVVAENSTGMLGASLRETVALKAKCDVDLARKLLREAETRGLPVVGANYGTFEGPTSDLPMDWGTLVPLWFVLRERRLKARVVIVAPSREIPIGENVKFGSVLARVLENNRRSKFVFIASADQAHAHAKSGPYGFNRAATHFDQLVIKAVKMNQMDSLIGLKAKFLEDAKPDSIWQIAILVGILRRLKMHPTLVSYEVPTYYGMLCAGFERIR